MTASAWILTLFSISILPDLASSGVQFAAEDLNDFLALEQSCILPLKGVLKSSRLPSAAPSSGSVAAPIVAVKEKRHRTKPKRPKERSDAETVGRAQETAQPRNKDPAHEAVVAKVTLSDCLSCSGCVTSAEEVLLRHHQAKALFNLSSQPNLLPVVTLSAQSCASLAAYHDLPLSDTVGKVSSYLRSLGVRYVLDAGDFAEIALNEAQSEFMERWHEQQREQLDPTKRARHMPILCSECPGFVLFIEKTHGKDLLPHLSQIKSAQAVAGSILKCTLAPSLLRAAASSPYPTNNRPAPSAVWHATVMPCHDKKLESAREQLRMPDGCTQETDLVMTTTDLHRLLLDAGVDLRTLPSAPLDRLSDLLSLARPGPLQVYSAAAAAAAAANSAAASDAAVSTPYMAVPPGGYGGGYMEAVARHAARAILNLSLPHTLTYHAPARCGGGGGAAADVRELTIRSGRPGQPELRFAAVYGFRHVQTLVNNLKTGRCHYHYVEVLSCPSACTNGGGQLPPPPPPPRAAPAAAASAAGAPAAVGEDDTAAAAGELDLSGRAGGGGAAYAALRRVNAVYDAAPRRRVPAAVDASPLSSCSAVQGSVGVGGIGGGDFVGETGVGGGKGVERGLVRTWHRVREMSVTEAIHEW